jgi:dihydrofolate reductase
MNAMPKYVVSKSLDSLKWNNSTLIKGNVMDEIKDLKKQPGLDILVFGSSTLVNDMVKHNLVDVFNLLVYPVVVGKGKRVFKEGNKAKLRLVESRQFGSGVVLLTYESKA